MGSGITPTGGSRVYKSSGRPFVRSQNIAWGYLDLNDIAYIDEATHANFAGTEVEGGDVLLNITGASIGRAALADHRIVGGNVNQHVCIIRPKKDALEPGFLAAFIISSDGQKQVDSFQAGGNRQGLNFHHVRSIRLAIPGVEEQRAIATALSDADALIESLGRLIAKKRAIKQAAMQQLLTGQTRLPGFTGEWEMKRLGDHVSFLKTGTNSRAELASNGRVAYLHYGDIHVRASVTLNPNAVTMPHIASSKVRHLDKLAPGDLVFVDASEDLEGVGKSVEITDVPTEGMVAGLHSIAARFDKDVLADGFKAYLQFCPQFIGTLRRLAAGTKVLATNRQHVASVEMELPCVAEQQAIAAVLSGMGAEIETLERRRDKARQTKQGMMQQLLTGRTRLV
ncbi:hypothetical protein TVD_06065 [Thioalkalivibrio versutus]|uniref:Type I restriction modification DNA specificity domain-containing protein n=1 Tax=Thioalkalivibrio versutus TaxID=106634 RepID=A0A0G3G5B4_9GAMM|nr:hypothetical protein TVD_06065 [Thioalkalivibrio versutus]